MREFEKLWAIMERIYPSQVIPPLPDSSENPAIKAKLLTLCLRSLLSHPILSEDEYFKEFLVTNDFGEKIPLIKNIEAPIQVKEEYFGGVWARIGGIKMTKDQIYIKVLKMFNVLVGLKERFKNLSSLFDRLNYEFDQVKKGADATSQSLCHLLYMSKADRIYAEDTERVEAFLKGIIDGRDEKRDERENFVCFLNFCIKYIRSIESLIDRLDRFRNFVVGQRVKLSELALKLDKMQMPIEKPPSFDRIYETKIRHERLLEELAVIEVTYERYSEFVEKEVNWIYFWIRSRLKEGFINFY